MSEWKEYKLGEITKWFSGGTPKKDVEEYWNGDIPWLSAVTMKGNRFNDSDKYITKKGLENGSRLAKVGSLLLLVRGSGLFNDIPVGVVTKELAFNQDLKSIEADDQIIHNWFLLYWLLGNKRMLYGLMEETAIGAGKFNTDQLKEIVIKVPSLKIQKKIVDVIIRLDNKIDLLRRQNQTLEQLAQTIFKQWFVQFQYPGANGKMQQTELGEVPVGWRVGKLEDELDILMGQSPDGESYNESGEGAIFFQGRTDFGFRFPSIRLYTTEPKRMAESFDTLVSVRAPVGDINMAFEKCCIGRGLAAVKSKSKSYAFYKMQYYKPKFAVFETEGTVFGSLGKDGFNELESVIPTDKIKSAFEELVQPIDKQIYNLSKEIQTLTQLRDSLLPRLMSGRLRVG